MTIEQTVQIAGMLSDVQELILRDRKEDARRLLNKVKRELFEAARIDAKTDLEFEYWIQSEHVFFTDELPALMRSSGLTVAELKEAAGAMSPESFKLFLQQLNEPKE